MFFLSLVLEIVSIYGFKMKKTGLQGKSVLLMTFLPPLAMVIVNPGIYLSALNYAGSFCIVLLLISVLHFLFLFAYSLNTYIL